MDITYLGHSSFKIKFPTAILVTDPFDPKTVGLKYPKISADIVTISHQHKDHNYFEGVRDYRKVIDGPGEYEVAGVSIIGLNYYHDEKKGVKRGRNVSYIIESQDLRLLHLGDLGHALSSRDVDEIGDIDVLFIPVGGIYTIGTDKAIEIVRLFEPNITIPMHYNVPGLNKDEFAGLLTVEPFLKELGYVVEKTDKLSLRDIDLGEESKVVVMTVKN